MLDIGDDLALAIANNFLSTDLTWDEISTFLKDWDQYPTHFMHHLLHASEVLHYKCPDAGMARRFGEVYRGLIANLHVNPETEAQMDARLGDQRQLDDRLIAACDPSP